MKPYNNKINPTPEAVPVIRALGAYRKGFNMKTIIVKWVPEEDFGYGKAMRVIESDHKRFTNGSRFDYGFFSIATEEGYTIISLPMDSAHNQKIQSDSEKRCPSCGLYIDKRADKCGVCGLRLAAAD